MTTVALESVTKVFPDGTVAVDSLDLEVADGELMVLLGPSGCGKTTVLRMIAGLEEVTSGEVYLGGQAATGWLPKDRRVAMVFQEFALYPHLTVRDNLAFPLDVAKVDPTVAAERVADLAVALGVADTLDRRPHQLSGGQRQRVAMGRAIIRDPQLFLLDEPLSNVDSALRTRLRAEISALVRELRLTTVYVTHDQTEALTMADRAAVLRDGVLEQLGTPADLYGRPATVFVAGFLGTPRMNLVTATVTAHLDSHVQLDLGSQALAIPWTDNRARDLARYHNERISLGVRAEAVVPTGAGTRGSLAGTVRFVEHHGHETLAYLDIGAEAVVDGTSPDLRPPVTAPGPLRPRRLRHLLSRRGRGDEPHGRHEGNPGAGKDSGTGSGRGERRRPDERPRPRPRQRTPGVPALDPGRYDPDSGRHRIRGAEFVLRLRAEPEVRPGEPLHVLVDTDALHFFDRRGKRIRVGWDR